MTTADLLTSPSVLAGCAAIAAVSIWHAWTSPVNERALRLAAGGVVTLMLLVLGVRPQQSVAGAREARIDTGTERDRAHATVEALALTLAPDAVVSIRGDGLDADAAALLTGRELRWSAPDAPIGLTILRWPRRAAVGERVLITGQLDTRADDLVTLEHPDGHRDTVRTSGDFRFVVVPRATGTWTWILEARGRSDTMGIQVINAPGPRVVMVEGRPNREGASLAKLVVAQGGGLLQRTRLTPDDERIVRHGASPDGRLLDAALLDITDVVILAPGAMAMLTAAERNALSEAMASGLGVVHLIDSTLASSAVQPFRVQQRAGDERVRVVIESTTVARTAIPVSSVSISGGVPLLRSATGGPVAWMRSAGRGTVVATRVTAPSRWSLAGEPDIEAAWWAAILGAAIRPPAAEWRVAEGALPRVDHPFIVERIGFGRDSVELMESGRDPVRIAMPRTMDSLRRRVVLWPSSEGWVSMVEGVDTLSIHVASRHSFATLDRSSRRDATRSAVRHGRGDTRPSAGLQERIPLWWAWAFMLAALTALWKYR